MLGDRAGGLRKADQPVDGLGKLGGAARAVAHLARDEARIDGAGAHDAGQRGVERPRAGALRVGDIEHDQVGRAAERRGRRREAAHEGGILGAFEQIAAGIVARMHQQVGGRDPRGELPASRVAAPSAPP